MREIKFRGWEKELKEMIPVNDIDFEKKMINTESAWRSFREVELMQYTGLKDKNGKEIYEGDILKAIHSSKLNGIHTVVWHDNGFMIEYKFMRKYEGTEYEDKNYSRLYPDSYEVIGNIYENTELLEGTTL